MKIRRLAALFIVTLAVTGCDGRVAAEVKVVDVNGKPVAGATAHLSRPGYARDFEASSRRNGCLFVGGTVAPGNDFWDLEVSAAGYKSARVQVPSLESNAMVFTLSPEAGRPLSTASKTERLHCGAL